MGKYGRIKQPELIRPGGENSWKEWKNKEMQGEKADNGMCSCLIRERKNTSYSEQITRGESDCKSKFSRILQFSHSQQKTANNAKIIRCVYHDTISTRGTAIRNIHFFGMVAMLFISYKSFEIQFNYFPRACCYKKCNTLIFYIQWRKFRTHRTNLRCRNYKPTMGTRAHHCWWHRRYLVILKLWYSNLNILPVFICRWEIQTYLHNAFLP